MIDYISTYLEGVTPEHILSNPELEFVSDINEDTGELRPNKYGVFEQVAKYGELEIIIKTNIERATSRIIIRGSLHKHCKGNNYSDFGFMDMVQTIETIAQVLKLNPERIHICQIEYGLNGLTALSTLQVLDNLLSHRGKEYELRRFGGQGYLKKFVYEQYDLKLYAKGLQYGIPQDIIRIEKKVKKMACIQRKGIPIYTMSDLLNYGLYAQLFDDLLNSVQGLIFTDDRITIQSIPNAKDRTIFKDYSNARNWTKLRTGERKTFNRRLQKFNSILQTYAPDDLKKNLTELLSAKYETLFQNVPFSPHSQKNEMSHFHTHIVSNKGTLCRRQCLTCGRDISGQRPGSLYCSETKHGRQVKKCRNIVSNLKVHELRLYPGSTLFPIDDYLTPEHRRIKGIAFKTLNYQ
jgi:hypothetical protein